MRWESLNKDIFVTFKFLIMIHTSPIIIIGGRVIDVFVFFFFGGGGGGGGGGKGRGVGKKKRGGGVGGNCRRFFLSVSSPLSSLDGQCLRAAVSAQAHSVTSDIDLA